VVFDDDGIPYGKICNHKLRNWGIINKSFRRKWLFPVQCDNCNKCPTKSSQSKYTKTVDNPRYFTPILRGSKEWNRHYKRRSTTERCWDRLNNNFHAEKAIVFSRERRISRVFLAAFCCYIDAWFKKSNLKITDIFPSLAKMIA
jgi:hypothetical protein